MTCTDDPARDAQGGPWYAVLLTRDAWPAQSMAVRADGFRRSETRLILEDAGKTVFSADLAVVRTVLRYADQRQATGAVRKARGAGHGGSTVHVEEGASAMSRGRHAEAGRRGAPAEGIAFRVEE